jgi:predicted homoserine dehydrogenase-like protein
LRGEPTGCCRDFCGDVVAIAKRPLTAGEILDGEGGYTVWGKLLPAADSLLLGGLPIGLAHGVQLRRDIPMGHPVRWCDVTLTHITEACTMRQAMEQMYRAEWGIATPPLALP